jgi:formylglycine-generating enzyme required for sulfatase activity
MILATAAGIGLWRVPAKPPRVCLATDPGMIPIPAGHFKMGSEDFRPEEAPVHDMSVEGFWIDSHDVTNAQFARFVAATGYVTVAERSQPAGSFVFTQPTETGDWWKFVPGADWRHPEGPGSDLSGRDNHPVVQVAFDDAQAYARWVGRKLPTEAEWEYAARGGKDGEAFLWDSGQDSDETPQANHWRGEFPFINRGSRGFWGTSPVGCFPANGYGLYDMVGNVWQWTRTAWAASNEPIYAIKGGSFLCAPNYCMRYRPAARQPGDGTTGTNHIGFRTVSDRPPPG